MGKQHIIELNGKRYDAMTGKIIADKPLTSAIINKAKQTTKSFDGVRRVGRKKPSGARPLTAHQPQKSQTLMRSAVARPKAEPMQKTSPTVIKHATSVFQAPKTRQERAKLVSRSQQIQKFNLSSAAERVAEMVNDIPQKTSQALSSISVAETVVSSSFSKALQAASSHELIKLPKRTKRRRLASWLDISPRAINITGFVIAALVVGGFFAYQNAPNLSMRLASARSGIHGVVPSYQPAGFGRSGAISYQPGKIVINYRSHSDSRNYQVTQAGSSWNSQSLLDNFVAQQGQDYQTVQDNGKTVYIYNDSNATWVDGGIWYRVEGESKLTSDQLLRLAASM